MRTSFHRLPVPAQLFPVVVLLFAQAVRADVDVDYDPKARFGEYETFALVLDSGSTLAERNPKLHALIHRLLREKLTAYGLREVQTAPELLVLYKAAVDEVVEMHTEYDYAYGDSWARFDAPGAGAERPTTREYRYRVGTLVIDTWDTQTDRLIWRGIADDVLTKNPRITERQVRRAIERIAEHWERIWAERMPGAS